MAATTGDRILFSLPRPALADPGRLGQIRRHLPVYVFSGTKNPVGQQLAGVPVLIGRYRTAGVSRNAERDQST
ncbi:MAG TPA: hypothetical protein VNY05_05845 [Candidatus Acidoferrales bacterium]|jgi:hypothetical protein|nr:hypothetical protein [Candidatus Acidoferrales bacterium]